jgi:tRNA A-37 threonylcarbamoyl transferase component Bud32
MRKDIRKKNVETALKGYKEALKQLEQENIIYFSKGYVKICRDFVDKAKSRRTQLVNLFKPAQKAMFTSMLGIFPKVVNLLSQNRGWLAKFQRIVERDSEIIHEIDDPQKYLYVATASELVPLTSEIGIEAFAREVLSADAGAEVTIEKIGGVLNDAFLIKTTVDGVERKVVVKRFKDWSSIKWFPLVLWTVGTRTFTVLGRSRLEKECTINQLLYSKGFAVPKLLYVNHAQRLLFMEYIEAESVDKVIRRTAESKSAKETKEGLEVITRVGEKIAQVHSIGIALGDTKPENILLDKQGEIYLLDLEQASRGGDKVWDIAEFMYYSGHYISPFASVKSAETIAEAFIGGYLKAGGNADIVRKAGNPKYTKVFSVFTFPHIMLVMSNASRKTRKLEG